MIILQATTNCISSIPYGIQFIYAVVTVNISKDQYRQAQEHLFLQITRLSYYVNFISAFYIYFIASEQIRSLVRCNWRNRWILNSTNGQTSDSLPRNQSHEIRYSRTNFEQQSFLKI